MVEEKRKRDEKEGVMTLNIGLSFEAYAEDYDGTWYLGYDHNGLYFFNNKTEIIEFVGIIPKEELFALRLYSAMTVVDDYLIMIPYRANEIAIYNKRKCVFIKVPLEPVCKFKYKAKNVNEKSKFYSFTRNGDCIIMYPHNYPAMVVFDLKSFKNEYHTAFFYELDKISDNDEPYVTDVYRLGDCIYGSCGNVSAFFVMNLNNYECKIHRIETKVDGFNGIYKKGNSVWLSPRKGSSIIKYDEHNKKVVEYNKYPKGFTGSYIPFHKIYDTKHGLLLFPDFANKFILLNEKNGKMKEVIFLSNIIEEKRNPMVYASDRTMAYSCIDDKIKFISGRTNELYIADLQTKYVKKISFPYKGGYPQCIEKMKGIFRNETFGESESTNITDFVMIVINAFNSNSIKSSERGVLAGESIYRYCSI